MATTRVLEDLLSIAAVRVKMAGTVETRAATARAYADIAQAIATQKFYAIARDARPHLAVAKKAELAAHAAKAEAARLEGIAACTN